MDSRLQHRKYDLQVHDAQLSRPCPTDDSVISTGVLAFVYTAGTKTLATIYADEVGTALANPITRTAFDAAGKIKFWSGAATHDIVVNDDKGNTGIVAGVAPTSHMLTIDRSGAHKNLVIPFVFNDNVETNTGIDLPRFAAVRPVTVEVVTADATETINVGVLSSGTGGDADGFVAGASLATAGFVRPYIVTDGTNEDFVATPSVGALIGLGSAGTDAANDFGQGGGHSHVVTAASETRITYTCSSGSDTAAGYLHIPFTVLR